MKTREISGRMMTRESRRDQNSVSDREGRKEGKERVKDQWRRHRERNEGKGNDE